MWTARILAGAMVACCVCLTGTAARAQGAFPVRAVTIIVPYAPGGAVDATARALALELSHEWGQTVVIDNRPGAQGMVGVAQLKRSAPDGHTLLIDTSAIAMNPSVFGKPLYEPRELAPVALVMRMPYVIAMAPGVGNSYVDLVAALKERPGALNAASSGTSSRLFAELFGLQTGTKFLHVTYAGAAPALLSVMKNETQLTAMDVPNIESFLASGKLKGVVVTGSQRASSLPAVPSAAEVGIPGFDASTWYGIFAPAGTTAPTIDRVNETIRRVLKGKTLADFVQARGGSAGEQTAPQFDRFYLDEVERWKTVIRQAGIEPQ